MGIAMGNCPLDFVNTYALTKYQCLVIFQTMKKQSKLLQLQIRISPAEKAAIQRAANRANMGMSEWVLSQILPASMRRFHELVVQLKRAKDKSYVLAELNDLFQAASQREFEQMVMQPPKTRLSPYWENYLAAMIEEVANAKETFAPAWVCEIEPLENSVFGSDLMGLRLYLLLHSPPAFRRRNIFIDSSVGQRV